MQWHLCKQRSVFVVATLLCKRFQFTMRQQVPKPMDAYALEGAP